MALYHSARGSVNYTIVGSPTIVDNVVSGFSADDYLVTTQQFSSISPEKLELQAKFTPTNLNNTYQYIVSYQTTGGLNGGKSGFRINSNNRLQYKVSYYSDGSGDLLITSSANIQVNSSIIAKGYYIGDGVYGLDVSTDGGNTWITDTVTIDGSKTIELNSSYGTYIGRTSTAGTDINVFSGSIDLKHTYIIVNGQPWFGICPIEVKKHQVMGPVGYDTVGEIVVTDGIATNITNGTNRIDISQPLPSVINSFEMVVSGKLSEEYARGMICYSYRNYQYKGFLLRYSGKNVAPSFKPFWRYKSCKTSSEIDDGFIDIDASSSHLPSTTAKFWVKVTMQPAEGGKFLYSYYDSIDGQTWYLLGSKEDTYQLTGDDMSTLKFIENPNYGATNTTNVISELDLNNTYIKVNGKLWFWQPQETKRIVVNGVEVWTKPE